MNPLAERIRSVRTRPRSHAVIADRRTSVGADGLVGAAEELRLALVAAAGRPQPLVAVSLPLSTDAVVALVAAILGDLSVCFVDPSASEEHRRSLLQALHPDVVLDRSGIRAVASSSSSSREPLEAGYVAMSSGSTGGGPKGVLSSWAGIDAFVPHGAAALDLDASSAWAEVSHLSYDLAMTNLLVALAAGSSLHLSGSLGDRLRPLGFCARVEATHLRLAPRFIDLAAAERVDGAPRSLRVWGSGGDRLSAADAQRVFDLGVPTVVNTYGTSETIGFASAARFEAGDDLPAVHGAVGIGRGAVGAWRTSMGSAGEMLAIESPHLPGGYLFGSPSGEFPRWDGPERVLTGDVGARRGEELFCLGRAGRRVKRSASFVDLDALDAEVKQAFGLATFTAATPEGALVSLVEGPEAHLDDLRRRLPTVLRPDSVPDVLVPVAQLPRTGNGKIDHAAAQALVSTAG
ncbi:Acyl-CoA synthetase (AMP-forming)/AMP-acid ligase II [Nocardioides sp. YR527]|uniref:AMP-binding protein n=1 Tax=Nocardioides sp. YR527 TaxID=1881028 RepID=UPI000890C7F7|nr:AMP-binding protein [Nocardioides sp. YR527]SDK96482.1 Acyl-CoA synthetase (AMP-forming)/AMP-acid ligase II [Nocardioides sp. YR527]